MTETEDTYCTNQDVEHRLALGEHYGGELEVIRDVRKRAHRWIKHRFAMEGKEDEVPDPAEELPADFDILRDVEATRAAYLYKRDVMEWASEQGTKRGKVERWKKDSESMLKQLFRSKWGDELYAFGGR